jgi:hypothetical protein
VKHDVLQRVKVERNILHRIQQNKTGLVTVCLETAFLKHVIEAKVEGRIEVTGRQARRRKQLLYDLKEKRGYWKSNEEALDSCVCEEIALEEAMDLS